MSDNQPVISPYTAVRWIAAILGLLLLVNGLYMIGPWYVILPGKTAFSTAASISPLAFKTQALLMMLSGLGTIYGARYDFNRFTYISATTVFVLLCIIVVTRLISVGLIPFFWTYQLALLLISVLVLLALRRK